MKDKMLIISNIYLIKFTQQTLLFENKIPKPPEPDKIISLGIVNGTSVITHV